MILAVLLLAGNVIVFSVWGLSQTFTFTALFWGSAIEISKLILASFLYRFRESISSSTKILGWSLVIGMMIITSLGIYGHILSGYQENSSEVTFQELRLNDARNAIQILEERIQDITFDIDEARQSIASMNRAIAEINTRDDNFITARARAAESIREDREILQGQLGTLLQQRQMLIEEHHPLQEVVFELESEMLGLELKIGPIVKLIEILGDLGERAMLWFILLIVLVFDPAAVYITIQANRVALSLKKSKTETKEEPEVFSTIVQESDLFAASLTSSRTRTGTIFKFEDGIITSDEVIAPPPTTPEETVTVPTVAEGIITSDELIDPPFPTEDIITVSEGIITSDELIEPPLPTEEQLQAVGITVSEEIITSDEVIDPPFPTGEYLQAEGITVSEEIITTDEVIDPPTPTPSLSPWENISLTDSIITSEEVIDPPFPTYEYVQSVSEDIITSEEVIDPPHPTVKPWENITVSESIITSDEVIDPPFPTIEHLAKMSEKLDTLAQNSEQTAKVIDNLWKRVEEAERGTQLKKQLLKD